MTAIQKRFNIFRATLVCLPAAIALVGCGGGGEVVATTAKVRLANLASDSVQAAYVMLHFGRASPYAPATLTGVKLGDVALPSLEHYGTTGYVDVPEGDYTLPLTPEQRRRGCSDGIKIRLAAGARVTLAGNACWNAIIEPAPASLASGEAEIVLLDVHTSTGWDGSASAITARSLQIVTPDDRGTVLASYPLTSRSVAVPNVRVPATGFRIRVDSAAGILFRSDVVSLPAGASVLGQLTLNDTASQQGLELYGTPLEAPLVAVDARSMLRVTNLSSRRVTWRVGSGDLAPSITLDPNQYYDGLALTPSAKRITYSAADAAESAGELAIQAIPGGRYDMVFRDTDVGKLVVDWLPGVFAQEYGGPFANRCFAIRVFNAVRDANPLSIEVRIESSIVSEYRPPVDQSIGLLAPGAIGVAGSYCGSAAGIYALSRITVDGVIAPLISGERVPLRRLDRRDADLIGPVTTGLVAAYNTVLIGNNATDRQAIVLGRTP